VTSRTSHLPSLPLYRNGRRSILHGMVFAIGTLQLFFRSFDVILADHMPYLPLFPSVSSAGSDVSARCRVARVLGTILARVPGRLGALGAMVERAERSPDVVVAVSAELARELSAKRVAPRVSW